MQIELMTITPKNASTMMQSNYANNRAIRGKVVSKYAVDMKNGRWKVTGDSIKFNKNGELMDGQHRLMACISANTPFKTYVATGVSNDAMFVIDTNAARNISDAERIAGKDAIYCAKNSAALARMIETVAHQKDNLNKGISHQELDELITKYYHLCRFANAYRGKGNICNVQFTTALFVAMINGYPKKKIKAFMDCVNKGEVDTSVPNVRWKAANDLRLAYESHTISTENHYARMRVYYETLKAIHCFCTNVCKPKGELVLAATEEQFINLNNYFSAFESFKEKWWL